MKIIMKIHQIILNIDLNNNNDEKDIILQINQMIMLIYLIEHLRLKIININQIH